MNRTMQGMPAGNKGAPDRKLGLHEETVNEESQNNAFFSSNFARKHFSTPIAPLMTVLCPFFFLIKQNVGFFFYRGPAGSLSYQF